MIIIEENLVALSVMVGYATSSDPDALIHLMYFEQYIWFPNLLLGALGLCYPSQLLNGKMKMIRIIQGGVQKKIKDIPLDFF